MSENHETLYQFIDKIVMPIFPIIWVFLVFSITNYRFFRKEKSVIRLLLIFIGCGMIMRYIHWIMSTRYSGRYTAPIVLITLLFAAPGLFKFVIVIYKKLKIKYPSIQFRTIFYIVLFLTTVGCLGKALRPQRSRPWQEDIYPVIHNALIDKTKGVIVIPTKKDKRTAYYAKARLVMFHVFKKNYKNLIARYKTPNIFLMSYVPLEKLPKEVQVMPKEVIKVYHYKKKTITLYLLKPTD